MAKLSWSSVTIGKVLATSWKNQNIERIRLELIWATRKVMSRVRNNCSRKDLTQINPAMIRRIDRLVVKQRKRRQRRLFMGEALVLKLSKSLKSICRRHRTAIMKNKITRNNSKKCQRLTSTKESCARLARSLSPWSSPLSRQLACTSPNSSKVYQV